MDPGALGVLNRAFCMRYEESVWTQESECDAKKLVYPSSASTMIEVCTCNTLLARFADPYASRGQAWLGVLLRRPSPPTVERLRA